MKVILSAMLLLAAGAGASASPGGIGAFIEETLPSSGAPGMAYAIADGDRLLARAHGVTRKGGSDPVTIDTPFRIGSLTKGLTALAIVQLSESGRVALDAPVAAYLPAFDRGPLGKVTIRQLLNHTSGLSTVQGNRLHAQPEEPETRLAGHASHLATLRPSRPPGAAFEYSNANYQILGAVIERVSGQSYADYMEARVFRPLSMTHSSVAGDRADPAIATGHRPWFGGTRAFEGGGNDRLNAPAGGVIASAQDMARYIAMLLNGRDDIVTAAGKELLLQPSGTTAPFYGLGWYVDAERAAVSHTGLVPGSEALVMLLPARRKGVVVLVNSNSGFGFAENWTLRSGVAARALGLPQDEAGSNWMPRLTWLSVAVLPPLFVLLAVVSWRRREHLRAKRANLPGQFSLWFPPAAMIALAWVLLDLVPRLFGGSLATLRMYQPDFALLMTAGAAGGIGWAAFRLILAYRRRPADPVDETGAP